VEAVICLEMVYPELAGEQRIERIAAAGFRAVEFWGWREKDLDALAAACRSQGVSVAVFSGHRRGSLVRRDEHGLVLDELREAAGVAETLGCRRLMLLSDELGPGGAVDPSRAAGDRPEKHGNLVAGLEQALAATPDALELVLEPLNTRIDHPGYYLDGMDEALAVIGEVDDPRLKILCDLYHLGVMGEDLEAVIENHHDSIGHYHVADFPGRHEPGTGGADWGRLLRLIETAAPRATVGFEYSPQEDSGASLDAIAALLGSVLAG
jgi:hydroxypyruvate isomerase